MIAIVVPAYRAGKTLGEVVRRSLQFADVVVVVDDACPERCADSLVPSDRLHVIHHPSNRGVGGATKTGMKEALRLGADYVVKVDSDGQMDPIHVPELISVLERYPEADMVKGNRFADASTLRTMPTARLVGNAGLTLLVKFSSGYWTIVDPTNGYIAIRAEAIRGLNVDSLADRYFFEIDLLCALGLTRRTIAELELPAVYGNERSSLSIGKTLATFPFKLLMRFLRRIIVNYLIVEINVGTLCGVVGFFLLLVGTIFGAHEWAVSAATGVSRPTGTIVLALLLFITGFQLSLQALLYDVQFSTRTIKAKRQPQMVERPKAVIEERV